MSRLLVAVLILMPMMAVADDTHGKRYFGVNVGFYEQGFDSASSDASLSTLEARVGGFLNEYAALELRLGAGLVGDEVAQRDVDLDYLVGAYTRVGAPMQNVFPYLALGFSRVQLGLSNPDLDASETSASYGLGLDLNVANLTVNLEYLQLADQNDVDVSGFTLGFTSTF